MLLNNTGRTKGQEPFGRLQAARRARAMDGPSHAPERVDQI